MEKVLSVHTKDCCFTTLVMSMFVNTMIPKARAPTSTTFKALMATRKLTVPIDGIQICNEYIENMRGYE
jgi:hypothetical protein